MHKAVGSPFGAKYAQLKGCPLHWQHRRQLMAEGALKGTLTARLLPGNGAAHLTSWLSFMRFLSASASCSDANSFRHQLVGTQTAAHFLAVRL